MKATVIALLVLATFASGEETRIPVPQGSAAFPTLGEVRCLEDAGTGRYCAATYECGDNDRGELWDDMDEGPRTVEATSPVATMTDCAIVVDGKASARWFTGYAPSDTVVSVTANQEAEPPVIRRDITLGGEGDGSWLSWFLAQYDIADWHEELTDAICGHIREGTTQRSRCEDDDVSYAAFGFYRSMSWINTPFTRCITELVIASNENFIEQGADLHRLYFMDARYWGPRGGLDNMSEALNTVPAYSDIHERWHRDGTNDIPQKYRECRALFVEQWNELDLGNLPE